MIYWVKQNKDLLGVIDDTGKFLSTIILTGPCRGTLNKHYLDNMIESKQWEIITNPLEAYALEIICNG